MHDLWEFIEKHLTGPVTIFIVEDHQGSTPGKMGFKLAVTPDQLHGTIGGGIMEFRLVEQARRVMAEGGKWRDRLTRVHRDRAPEDVRSGMICAGTQQIVVCTLSATDRESIHAIRRTLDENRAGVLTIAAEGLRFEADVEYTPKPVVDGSWYYREQITQADTVYVIGGGHVGLALSRVLALLDLDVHVFDHRPGVATMQAVACKKTVIGYDRLADYVVPGDRSYVVIVTTAFDSDTESLRQVIHKPLKYLGVMGSQAKLKRIFTTLAESGIDPGLFEKVRAPLGVPINNRTPAEIGISIAAEIIKIRNAGD